MEDERTPGWMKPIEWVTHVCTGLAATAGLLLLLNVVFDVVGRAALNAPIGGTLEYVQYWWMPTVVFLALGLTQARDEHIRAPVLVERLRGRTRVAFEVGGLLAGFVTVAFLVVMGWGGAMEAASVGEAALGTATVPIWPVKFVAVFGLVVLALQLVVSIYRTISLSPDPSGPEDQRDT